MRWIASALGALVLGAAGSAAATDIVTATYSGSISSGVDGGGIFGPVGGNLAGDPFSVTFVFDADLGTKTPGGFYGGPGASPFAPNPLLSVELVVGGVSYADTDFGMDGATGNALYTDGVGGALQSFYSESYGLGQQNTVVAFFHTTPSFGKLISVSPAYSGTESPDSCAIPFEPDCGNFALNNETFGGFVITAFSINYPPATFIGAPEPSTWLILLAGFSVLGTTLRSRRSTTTA